MFCLLHKILAGRYITTGHQTVCPFLIGYIVTAKKKTKKLFFFSQVSLVLHFADRLSPVRGVPHVEGASKFRQVVRLPESYLQRRHWTLSVLHKIGGFQLFACRIFFFLNPLGRIYNMLNHFLAPQLSQLVQSAVENNSLTIEPVAMTAIPMVKASAVECGGPKWVVTLTLFTLLSLLSVTIHYWSLAKSTLKIHSHFILGFFHLFTLYFRSVQSPDTFPNHCLNSNSSFPVALGQR